MDETKLKNVLNSLMEKELVVFNKNVMDKYPNLQAVLSGCVSHPVTSWPGVRAELKKLIQELDRVYKEIYDLKGTLEEGVDCRVCGRQHFE